MLQENEIIVYHGGIDIIEHPSVTKSRIDIDFGVGFYLTQNKKMAEKWACSKATSFLNTYSLNMNGIKTKYLKPDQEWLNYICYNRIGDSMLLPFDDQQYDIIIGPTADDRIFTTLDLYMDGMIDAKTAITTVNIMKYSEQIVIKSQNVIENGHLSFVAAKEIKGQEKQIKQGAFRADILLASERTKQIMRTLNRE